ncbi:unnamed protein product [Nezara viridula]|uniref:Uncharacterized protein n=1 Tax=Nezara viridula TaxID=85310 RepID=A0A9P0EDZ0_NEZVI|nr:unnamed protein product [Nezara viridula]
MAKVALKVFEKKAPKPSAQTAKVGNASLNVPQVEEVGRTSASTSGIVIMSEPAQEGLSPLDVGGERGLWTRET